MAKQIAVTIVGPGNLGTALSRALHAAGMRVAEIVYRGEGSERRAKKLAREIGAKAIEFSKADFRGDLIWLCVGDSVILPVARALLKRRAWKGVTVFHSSGALSSDELEPLRRNGAEVASVHPMMTFVPSSAPTMTGAPFAIEGDPSGVRTARGLVKRLGGEGFLIAKEDKPLYHALGAFVSPLIVAQMAAAERIGRELGWKPQQTRKIIAPILQRTVRNYVEHGPAAAFSGPIVRGDGETVRKNLSALQRVPGAEEIYRALAKVAVKDLPSKDARAIAKAINDQGNLEPNS